MTKAGKGINISTFQLVRAKIYQTDNIRAANTVGYHCLFSTIMVKGSNSEISVGNWPS